MLRGLTLLLCLVVPSLAFAAAADPGAFTAAKQALQSAVDTGRPEEILAARGKFETLAAAAPGDAALHLWLAVADWRVVPLLARGPAASQGERYCKDGLEHAGRAIQLEPRLAEAHAVKAALLGVSLNFHPDAMMTVGPEIEETMSRATRMDPKGPRVQLLAALNDLHKPKFVGGGPEKAMEGLRRAIDLYAAAAPAKGEAMDWGRDDALLWAGRAAMMLHDPKAARDYYRQALEANPDNGWVRARLLPEAEQALADSAAAPGTGAAAKGNP